MTFFAPRLPCGFFDGQRLRPPTSPPPPTLNRCAFTPAQPALHGWAWWPVRRHVLSRSTSPSTSCPAGRATAPGASSWLPPRSTSPSPGRRCPGLWVSSSPVDATSSRRVSAPSCAASAGAVRLLDDPLVPVARTSERATTGGASAIDVVSAQADVAKCRLDDDVDARGCGQDSSLPRRRLRRGRTPILRSWLVWPDPPTRRRDDQPVSTVEGGFGVDSELQARVAGARAQGGTLVDGPPRSLTRAPLVRTLRGIGRVANRREALHATRSSGRASGWGVELP